MQEKYVYLPEEIVLHKILKIRGRNVMLDQDLAELYQVETKRLNEQVKRNLSRFPADFMFQLTKKEFENLKSQVATSRWGGRRNQPYAFTEHGVLMLSSVLRSERAIEVNIEIMRIFIKMRHLLQSQENLLRRIEKIESDLVEKDNEVNLIFAHLKKLMSPREQKANPSRKIGFK